MSKTKKSIFAKLWILVAILSIAWMLFTILAPMSHYMDFYDNHTHVSGCEDHCPQRSFDSGVEYAMKEVSYDWSDPEYLSFWGLPVLIGANGIMAIVCLARKKAAKNPAAAASTAPVAIPAPSAEEQVVLERSMFFNWFKITVTTKRVMYKGIFWRRMNLPLNRISAVGTGIFGFLHIGSSAGHIMMIFFRHYREVYETIGTLLAQVE